MEINTIVKGVNQLLAGERHSYAELKLHLDQVVDDINAQLNAKFPAFSELDANATEYTLIPDRYIRSVILTGAAWYYYVTDEEGEMASAQYTFTYERNLFMMIRDYINLVPLEYRADLLYDEATDQYYYNDAKTLELNKDVQEGPRGVSIDASYIIP